MSMGSDVVGSGQGEAPGARRKSELSRWSVRPTVARLWDAAAPLGSRRFWGGWRGYVLAILAVAVCAGLRAALEPFGTFYYLPLVPAVAITALLSRRGPTALSIALSIALNLTLVRRDDLLDAAANAALFIVESWLVAELCWAQRRAHRRALDLDRSLAGRNALLDTVLASVPVVILDRNGKVRRMTPAAAEMFGVDVARTGGMTFDRFLHGFSMDRLDPLSGADGGAPAPEHWIGRRPDGRPLIVTLQLGMMPTSAGGKDHAALCLVDVTETHAANEKLRELDVQLNRIWRLNSLGEMAATLAHELNQPLSAAATYMHASGRDIEKAGLLGQSAGRTLDLAKAQMLRAGGIIRRMRELVTTGDRNLKSERVSGMIEDLGPALTLIGRDRGIDIRPDVDDRADRVLAERIQFQQALINLVRNAVDAVQDRANPTVVVTGRPIAGDLYRVTVEDNGPGIPPDQVERVFRPMTTTKSTGMGLGLSVTRTIVEGHGGQLTVSASRLGGARFQVDIPREREDA